MNNIKLCKDCNINTKYVSPKGYKSSYCSNCNSKRVSIYQKTDKGRQALRKGIRNYNRKKNGFSPELFDKLLADQTIYVESVKKI